MWRELYFGKHNGLTLPQILFRDPDWFFWAQDDQIFSFDFGLSHEAEKIYQRATAIKIPDPDNKGLVAEYIIDPVSDRFSELRLIPRPQVSHDGFSRSWLLDRIDMSIPRQIAEYDKTGCRILVREMKYYLFDNESCRMNARRCAEFFNDGSNFILP